MRRLARCLVVCLLASAAAWIGCRDDLDDEAAQLALALDAATEPVPDAMGSDAGSGEGGMPDAMGSDAGSGGTPDAILDAGTEPVPDAVPDAMPDAMIDAGSGGGMPSDAIADAAGDAADRPVDDAAGGRPDALRGGELEALDRTSFYACAGGSAPAGIEVGAPIALALALAVRRRRRWRASR